MFRKQREARQRYEDALRGLNAVEAGTKQLSVIAEAETRRPTDRLLDLALAAAQRARGVKFKTFANRQSGEPRWFEIWPGEHYKLLAGMIGALDARRIVEIGTFTGMSALALLEALPPDGRLATFDITPWREIPDTWLTAADFESGNLVQHIDNLANSGVIERHVETFADADFIFIDGPKDGVTEPKFLGALERVRFNKQPIVLFDDIRVLNMAGFWRGISRPKLDLTSFGHWSGTGLVDWNG